MAESFQVCLSNSEGFSESSYRAIRNLVDNFDDTINYNAESEQMTIGGSELNTRESLATIIDNPSIEIIDSINDSEINNMSNTVIDIHRETGQNMKRKKSKRHNTRSQDQFINVTPEDMENDNRKKKKSSRRLASRDARPNVTTRSMKRNG